jgi:MFS family permease
MLAINNRSEWRRGWPLLLTSLFCYGASVIYTFSMGLFIAPIQREIGWNRGEITSGLLINGVLSVFSGPLVGWLVDRFGARRVGIPGIMIYCAGLALLATTGRWVWSWWGLWVILSIGSILTKPTVWVSAVSKRFSAGRGFALGVMMCGAGLASAVLPMLTNTLIDRFGWRVAYVVLGGVTAAISLPLLLAFFHDTGRGAPSAGAINASPALPGLSIREALLSSRFLRLSFIALVMTVAIMGLDVHFVPMLAGFGVAKSTAAAAAGVIGVGAILGRLATGLLLDRFHGAIVGAVAFLFPALAAGLILATGAAGPWALVIAFVLGLGLGTDVDIIAYLATRYFGLRHYGAIFGTIVAILALAAGIGPTIAGMVFDYYGSYAPFTAATIGVFVLSAVLIGSLGPYPVFAEYNRESEPSEPEPLLSPSVARAVVAGEL